MGQIKNIKLHIVTDIKVLHLTKTTTLKMPGGVTVKDVNPQEFVRAFAAHLKKSKLKVPEYVEIVKTSKAHELGPTRLVLRSCSIGSTTRIPPSQCWGRRCSQNLWRSKEKWNETCPLLFVVIECCPKSPPVARGYQACHEGRERGTQHRTYRKARYGPRRWTGCTECCR